MYFHTGFRIIHIFLLKAIYRCNRIENIHGCNEEPISHLLNLSVNLCNIVIVIVFPQQLHLSYNGTIGRGLAVSCQPLQVRSRPADLHVLLS